MKPVGAADLDAMLRDLPAMAEYVSEDDIAALRQAIGEQEDVDRQNLEMNETAVLLEYRSGGLDGVTVEARHIETQFANARIFSMAASDVLRICQRANGGPGRYRSNEAAFDNIAVSLYAFSQVSERGEVQAATRNDRDFRARSLTLRCEPYMPADELDQFVSASFE
ncbi:hypothetical protein [Brevundimonas sp.]|uniref:hypothetical protein n=1 Tax=Brevundimonas sp. TaxID=1871086 RepID=UPI003D0D7586